MNLKIKGVLVSILIALLLVLIVAWNYFSRNINDRNQLTIVELPATPVIDSTVNIKFYETFSIDTSVELNTGLTIQRMATVALEGIPTAPVNYVSFLVLNHTEEAIVFSDIGFGVQVFQYDSGSLEWSKVVLPYIPEKSQKILPPKTESFDYSVLNTWEFNDEDFRNVNADVIRIFIKGEGVHSSKTYGAYMDLTLQR